MADTNLLYKIIILDLLDKAGFALSHAQISQFFTDYGYANYFAIQPVIHDLDDTGMIASDEMSTTTFYSITEEGRRTLSAFQYKITEAIEKDIETYLKDNEIAIQRDNSVIADYVPSSEGGYLVHCSASESGHSVMEINLHVSTKEQAEVITLNWKSRFMDVYGSIMDQLIH